MNDDVNAKDESFEIEFEVADDIGSADAKTGRSVAIMPGDVSLPRREQDSHKGDYGRVLIVGGSVGYTGAPVLSAKAASRTGAGLVYLGVPSAIYDITAGKLLEEMPFPLPDKDGRITGNAAGKVLQRAKSCDVCLIGPGLGVSDDITELVQSITRIAETPLVLDADGLNAVAQNLDILSQAVCPLILTPHPGEFARLGGMLTGTYGGVYPGRKHATHSERLRASLFFAQKYNCILVLKGHKTIIALPNGDSYVNTTGGPALAKGGTGDVLAGMIAALIAQRDSGTPDGKGLQGLTIADAVVAAVYLHGLAGDMCGEAFGEYSVIASDIIKMIPQAMKTVISEE